MRSYVIYAHGYMINNNIQDLIYYGRDEELNKNKVSKFGLVPG
jgi:hypothetical protein